MKPSPQPSGFPSIQLRRPIERRAFLKGVGVAMALPFLDAMTPAFGKTKASPRRFVGMCHSLGFYSSAIIPTEAGRDYKTPLYLQGCKDLRSDLTIISGTSHPDVGSGHASESSFLTAAPHAGKASYRNSISLDQVLAEKLGGDTRYSSLAMTTASNGISFTPSGAMIPAEKSPSRLFGMLFTDSSPEEQAQMTRHLQQGRSIMDLVRDDAKRLGRELGAGDREKLDDYFTTIRDVEQRLAMRQDWVKIPKPHPDAKAPKDVTNSADISARTRLMLDVMALALQADSVRVQTLLMSGQNSKPPIRGVEEGHHPLSHHGQNPNKIAQLELVEKELIDAWAGFVRRLKAIPEGDGTLLDRTVVLLGSNLGNANSHDVKNLPILLCGGGFKHGQHLAFDPVNNERLPNLYVSIQQLMGVESDRFASSKGTLRGLEVRA